MIEGMRVANILRTGAEAEHFNQSIRAALRLVRMSSPIRYRRIVRYLSRIHNDREITLASFTWPSRVCTIDFPKVLEKYPDYVETLAAILVHESIHGLIWVRGIWTTEANFDHIERVCQREELRFSKWLEERT